MDKEALEKRVEDEAEKASAVLVAHPAPAIGVAMRSVMRPYIERLVELEEGITELEAQSKADAEHRATLAQEVIDLNTALEEAARRLKASEARAEIFKGGVRGLALQVCEMERRMEKAGQS